MTKTNLEKGIEMHKNIDLGLDFAERVNRGEQLTWDDFFDIHNIPKNQRSDFFAAAIINNAAPFIKNSSIKKTTEVPKKYSLNKTINKLRRKLKWSKQDV